MAEARGEGGRSPPICQKVRPPPVAASPLYHGIALCLFPSLGQVKSPSGDQLHDFRNKISHKFDFTAHQKGVHHFLFTNRSPYHETIDFYVHVGHFSYYDEHAKDEHFKPLFNQIWKLEEALYNIQFEQHWLEAQTELQAIVNEAMSHCLLSIPAAPLI